MTGSDRPRSRLTASPIFRRKNPSVWFPPTKSSRCWRCTGSMWRPNTNEGRREFLIGRPWRARLPLLDAIIGRKGGAPSERPPRRESRRSGSLKPVVITIDEEAYGRCQSCAAVSLQSQSWSHVPLLVPPPVTSRQRPDCGFIRRLCCRQRHSWAPVPLQSQSWIRVPLPMPPPVTSIHLSKTRSVPSALLHVQLCALEALHAQIWTAVPLFVLPPASSMHLPLSPTIGPAPRYFASTTDGVSRL